ncbi:MAG: protein kinase domain-containing protein [Planctomycetota bacterium]
MSLTPEEQEALDFLDFQEDEDTALPEIGEDVAGYRILREIGSGGGGVVFEALQVEIDRRVAVKMIPMRPHEMQEGDEERIRREARLLAALEHPGIIEIFDSGVIPGYRWVAMQYVAGPSLRAVVHGEADDFPLRGTSAWTPFLAAILHQIAEALAEAHKQGVLHLDVKPSNILLESSERAYLVDFGIARSDNAAQAESHFAFRGTPKYAAPEQLTGRSPSPASDVYAFGCLAFEALNGEVPFPHANTMRGLRDVQVKLPTWTHARGISKDLLAIINRCLEKDPLARYPDADALAQDLGRFLRFEPVHASNRSLPSRLWLRMRLRPKQSLMACSILILALVSAWLGDRMMDNESQIMEMQVSEDLGTAYRLFHGSDWDALELHFDSLDLEDPSYSRILALKADLHLARAEFPAALEAYQETLESGRDLPGSRLGLAYLEWKQNGSIGEPAWPEVDSTDLRTAYLAMIVAEQLHEPDRVLAYANHALAKHPTSHFLLDAKAFACSLTGRHSEAINILKDCLAIKPSGADQTVRLLQSLNHLSRFRESIRTGDAAVLRGQNISGIFIGLAQAAQNIGRLEDAWDYAREARLRIASFEDESYVLQLEAALLRSDGKRKEAMVLLEGLLERDPEHPQSIASMARFLLRSHDFEEAQKLTDALARVDDYRWQLKSMMLQIRIHTARDETDRALELLTTPEMIRFGNRARIDLLKKEKGLDVAIDAAYEAIAEEPGDLGLQLLQVELLRDAKRLQEAHDQAMNAFSLDPGGAKTSYWLASVLWNRGDVEMALKHARNANVERPDWSPSLYLEAECLHFLGDKTQAEVLFARAEALDSKRKRSR